MVAAAAEAGVTTLALTDHDSVDGIAEADDAASEAGLALVPAAEMSAIHASIDDLHVLGYWIDAGAMAPACERAQAERVTRAEEIVAKLNEQGVEVKFEDAIAAGGRRLLGRVARTSPRPRATSPMRCRAFFEEWLVSRAPRPSSRGAGPPPGRRAA